MTEPWLDDEEQTIWRAYLRSHILLAGQLNRQLERDSDMSHADYSVLVNLSEAPEKRLRGFELAAALQWEKSRLSHQLRRMEARGLVTREECPTDRRGAFVSITPEGSARIEKAAPLHAAEVRRWFIDVFSPEDLQRLGALCASLVERLESGMPLAIAR